MRRAAAASKMDRHVYGAVVTGSFSLTPVQEVEFTIVGPRAMGMGGAGVAVTTDALATYWNPAGMAMSRTVERRRCQICLEIRCRWRL